MIHKPAPPHVYIIREKVPVAADPKRGIMHQLGLGLPHTKAFGLRVEEWGNWIAIGRQGVCCKGSRAIFELCIFRREELHEE